MRETSSLLDGLQPSQLFLQLQTLSSIIWQQFLHLLQVAPHATWGTLHSYEDPALLYLLEVGLRFGQMASPSTVCPNVLVTVHGMFPPGANRYWMPCHLAFCTCYKRPIKAYQVMFKMISWTRMTLRKPIVVEKKLVPYVAFPRQEGGLMIMLSAHHKHFILGIGTEVIILRWLTILKCKHCKG